MTPHQDTTMGIFLSSMDGISMVAAEMIGYIGVIIMCMGAIMALLRFVISTKRQNDRLTEIRIDLAKHLSLGLEFLVAKDIIDTLISPSFNKLSLLGFLVIIRTGISLILSWELKTASEEIHEEQEFEEALLEFEETQKRHKNHHSK